MVRELITRPLTLATTSPFFKSVVSANPLGVMAVIVAPEFGLLVNVNDAPQYALRGSASSNCDLPLNETKNKWMKRAKMKFRMFNLLLETHFFRLKFIGAKGLE